MKDRQPTQVLSNGAIRYGIYNADGTLDHYEYMKREDAPTVEGTPLNKANLLSDATAKKVWPAGNAPDDPTVNDAFGKLANGTARVGDISITARPAPSANWLPCDGRSITNGEYPDLFEVLRTSVTPAQWETKLVGTIAASDGWYDRISIANGFWFRSTSSSSTTENCPFLYSEDLETWSPIPVPTQANLNTTFGLTNCVIQNVGTVHYYENRYVCAIVIYGYASSQYRCECSVMYSDSQLGPWNFADFADIIYYDTSGYYLKSDYVDVLYGNSTYVIPRGRYTYTTSDITGKWATYDAGYGYQIFGLMYNPYDEMWYGGWGRNPSSGESGSYFWYLAKASFPTDISASTVISDRQNGMSELGIAFAPDMSLFVLSDNNYAYIRNTDNTLTIGTYDGIGTGYSDCFTLNQSATSLNWKYPAYVNGIWIVPGDEKLLLSDDLSSGFTAIDTTGSVTTIASTGNLAVAALASNTAMYNLMHDFTYDAKKIPNITPDSRSHAYIKAAEE